MKKYKDSFFEFIFGIYICFKFIFRKRKKESRFDGAVLLATGGHIGDALADASAWDKLVDYYSAQNKQIYFIAPKASWKVLRKILCIEKVTYIEGGTVDLVEEYGVRKSRRMLSILEGIDFNTIMTRLHGDARLFSMLACLPAQRKVAILENNMTKGKKGLLIQMLSKQYTDIIVASQDINQMEYVKMAMIRLKVPDYYISIAHIPVQCKIKHSKSYITIAVDSLRYERRWTSERFIELIEQLLILYDCDILITGTSVSKEDMEKYEMIFRGNHRVKNTVGKLNFDEWIETLRGALFHVGVDSGSIHIAASVGTTAFCLTGVWQGHSWFPYVIEKATPDTAEPICIYRQDVDIENLSCYNCVSKKEYGFGNELCREQCRNKMPCLCLTNIMVEDVLKVIREKFMV